MITKKFDISKKPLNDKAAYLVDYNNVELHRQYVEKYYSNYTLTWFDTHFIEPIRADKSCKPFLYYYQGSIGVAYNAHNEHNTIYVAKTLMTVD